MGYTVIDHPPVFRRGPRVLMLKGRHKDGIEEERQIVKITHGEDHFEKALADLLSQMHPGERIYASAGARDMSKAVRLFKQRQLDADYDDDPMRFYRAINERWASALMAPTSQSQSDKLWLFDCDSAEDAAIVRDEIEKHYDRPRTPYAYHSKSGVHLLVAPFNRSKIDAKARSMIHENPIMLWAY